MYKALILAVCASAVFSAPVDHPVVGVNSDYIHHPAEIVPIVSEEFDNKGDGNFRFGFVTGDGTKVEEEGALKIYDEKNAEAAVRGKYEYVSPEGRNIKVEYYADGTGFHAFSDDIPKSADVSSPAQYGNYIQGRQYDGVYNQLIAAEQPVVPVVQQTQPSQPVHVY